jgi:hypothetical protein
LAFFPWQLFFTTQEAFWPSLQFDGGWTLAFYVIGTLSSSLLASIAFQNAVGVSKDASYVSLYNAAIPGMSALAGFLIFLVWPRPELFPNLNFVATMPFVAGIVFFISFVRWKDAANITETKNRLVGTSA